MHKTARLQYRLALPLVCAVLFLISFGISYKVAVLSEQKGLTKPYVSQNNVGSTQTKDTATCPLNGAQYPKEQEKLWQSRRPLGVMIENHIEARPQSGLNEADIVYEAVAEGGITRFLAIFYCNDADPVGPVRSARTFFIDFISEYDGLYAHVGGAGTPGPADALGQIQRYRIKDLDQFSLGFPTYAQDKKKIASGIAIEHTMFSSTPKLWDIAKEKFGWEADNKDTKQRWDDGFENWSFIDETVPSAKPQASISAQSITVPFWGKAAGNSYTVTWTYDSQKNIYLRENGGVKHLDALTQEQVGVKNVVIAFMTEERANDGYPGNLHLLYGTSGSGDAVIFNNGSVIKAVWRKKDRVSRLKFFDDKGNELSFVRGNIWIQIMPTYNKAGVVTTGITIPK